MNELYVVRHGIAVPHGTPGVPEDERPLTRKGEVRMRQIGRGLAAIGLEVDIENGAPVAVNLGTGTGRSVREVVGAARRVTGRPVPVAEQARRPGDPPELVAAVARARTVLGWQAAHSSLEEILDSAWRWHQAHPHGYRGG